MSDFISSNPVSNLYPDFCGDIGSLGFVVSKPGLGKSTLVTLIGLHSLLRGDTVLHVSLKAPQQHVRKRYDHILESLLVASGITESVAMRKSVEQYRLVHSLLNQNCDANDIGDKLELFNNLLDFKPNILIVDGLNTDWVPDTLEQWAHIATQYDCMIWITAPQKIDCPHTLEIIESDSGISILNNETPLKVHPQTMLPISTHATILPDNVTLFSGGTMGAEAFFGEIAESIGMREVNFTFEGHEQKRTVGKTLLNERELTVGATSLSYVSNVLNRNWKRTEKLQKVVQVLWHIVSHADQIFVVGTIQPDGTVHGGTGWSVELAKRWYKPIWVFDQSQGQWFTWNGQTWDRSVPTITSRNIAGSGTRFLNNQGKEAIRELFRRSFQ